MPWECRKTGRYFYKAVRINGQPRHMYLGTGPAARMHEILDREQHRKHRTVRAELKVIVAEFAADNREWHELWNRMKSLAAASMLLSGHYYHHGQWRKVMGNPRTRQNNSPSSSPEQADELFAHLRALNERANAGEPGSLVQLQALLHDHPELWETVGDLNRITRIAAVTRLGSKDAATRESILRHLEEWRGDLIGPRPTAIESAIADTAVSAKLALTAAEMQSKSDHPSVAAVNAKRLDRAQYRLNATLKTLHDVQRANGSLQISSREKPPDQPPMSQAV